MSGRARTMYSEPTPSDRSRTPFPEDATGRVALGIAAAFFLPVCAMYLFSSWFLAPRPRDWLGWVFAFLCQELFIALFQFFACGLLWAIATPRFLRPLLSRSADRLSLALFLFSLPAAVVAICVLCLS